MAGSSRDLQQIVFVGPHQARLETAAFDLDELAPDEVALETIATLISTGTELANFTGLSPNVWIPGAWGHYPHVPGYAAVGRVLRVGEEVARFGRRGAEVVPGVLVFAFTPHASLARAKVSHRLVSPLEPDADIQAALLVRMAMVAYSSVRALRKPAMGRSATIIGLGLVGLFAAQLMQLAGAEVRAYDLAPARVEIARRLGIEAGIGLPSDQEAEDMADIVIEAIGNPRLAPRAVKMARSLGEVILLGTPRGSGDDAGQLLSDVHFKGVSLTGAFEWLPPFRASEAGWGPSLEDAVELILRWTGEGRLKTEGLISDVVSPSRAQEVYQSLADDPNRHLGVVFDWKVTGVCA